MQHLSTAEGLRIWKPSLATKKVRIYLKKKKSFNCIIGINFEFGPVTFLGLLLLSERVSGRTKGKLQVAWGIAGDKLQHQLGAQPRVQPPEPFPDTKFCSRLSEFTFASEGCRGMEEFRAGIGFPAPLEAFASAHMFFGLYWAVRA